MTKDLAIFHIDADDLDSDTARRARWRGLWEAKTEAMQSAARLSRWGLPLLVFILLVSGLHVWETIAAIRPAFVPHWTPHWAAYYGVAALFTVGIDLAALYLVAANSTLALAGMQRRQGALWFLLVTTFLLNAAFIVRFAPELPAGLRAMVLPALDVAFVVLLPAFIPIGLLAVESSRSRLNAARLRLLVEVRTLEALLEQPDEQPAVAVAMTNEARAILRLRLAGQRISNDVAQAHGYANYQAALAATATAYAEWRALTDGLVVTATANGNGKYEEVVG